MNTTLKDRIAIYTAITGSYDTLIQPCTPDEGFDFICFVPKGKRNVKQIGYWQVEELPVDWPDNTVMARFPKLNPQTVLKDYQWSLWIDGNIAIKDSKVFSICRKFQTNDVKYAGIKHPERDCTYDEAEKILNNGRENLRTVLKAVKFLNSRKLKRHAGLQETNVLFRKHNDEAVLKFDRLWWECLLRYAGGHRDQLMHSFCLQDTPNLVWTSFLPEGKTTRNFSAFEYVLHKRLNNVSEKPWLIRKWIYMHRSFNVTVLKLYLRLFVK